MPNWSFLALVEGEAASIALPRGCKAIDVAGQNWAAVWISEQKPSIFSNARAAAAKALLRYQQALEHFGPSSRLLAGTLSAIVDEADIAAASASLAGYAPAIAPHMATYGARRQFQVALSWDVPEVLTYAQGHSDDAEAETTDGEAAPKPTSEEELIAQIDSLIARSRAQADTLFDSHITTVLKGQSLLPYDGHTDGLRRVLMIDGADEDRLFEALEAFDADMFVPSKIQLAGPLPTISFAHVSVTKLDGGAEAQACARLGLDTTYDAAAVDAAFKKTAFALHGDVADEGARVQPDMARLKADRQMLTALAAARADGAGEAGFLWQVVEEGLHG